LFTSHKDVFERVAEAAKDAGAIHHQFLLGDGEVVIVDEWDTAESFQAFFAGNPDIPGLMEAGGVQGPPEIAIYETTDSPDKF
jgi:heme-degrading monooxygenase HmoA